MKRRFTWGKVLVIGLVLCLGTAQAADVKLGGNAEAGFAYGTVQNGAGDAQFMVDAVNVDLTATVSDKTSVFMSNAFAFGPANGGYPNGTAGTANFWNALGSVAGFYYAINEAYVAHKCMDGLVTKIGMFETPFSMEGMSNRYDYHSYYYTTAYNTLAGAGWNYDLGLLVNISEVIPGELEVAVIDGKDTALSNGPGAAARYNIKIEANDMEFTPVASVYASHFNNSGPNDFGFSGGMKFKMQMFSLNAEFLQYGRGAGGTGVKLAKTRSIWFEPAVDLGVVNISAKLDLGRVVTAAGVATNDKHIGAAISKSYENFRVRLAWAYMNMSGNFGAKAHDVRLLFGTAF